MCGIVGIHRASGEGPPSAAEIARSLRSLAHRGPDQQGIHEGDGVVLGSRRLSVVDPEGGGQPFRRGSHVLVTSGEIYDHVEERDRLEARGIPFRTRSDGEVLLAHLAAHGLSSLATLTGMYAFAWWDGGTNRLTLARDPFGMKPLLVDRDRARGETRFASELGALLVDRPETRLDTVALVERLAFQLPLSRRTLVRGIENLPPGTSLRVSRSGRATRETFALEPPPEEERPETDWAEEVREELLRAGEVTVRSDVPVGVCLSGGLDSSLVAALAARATGAALPAFTGYFADGPAFDERDHARRAARETGLSLEEVQVRPADLLDSLGVLGTALEGPIAGPGALPQLVVARAASRRVRVVLTGQGADELFGGYARHRIALLDADGRLDANRLPPDLAAYRSLALRLPEGAGRGDFAGRAFRLVYRGGGLEELLGPAVLDAWRAYDAEAAFRDAFGPEGAGSARRLVRFERRYLLPALLHVEDRVTMVHSVESRAPLLTPRLLELSERIPAERHVDGTGLKRMLRRAAEGLAPACAVARRDKMGFPVPLGEWARGPLRAALRERLEDGPLVASGILRPGVTESLLEGAGSHGRHLWLFLVLSEWLDATGVRP
jgi:asparagine synthase (glutamine-hydrolysing)